jgi:hypothetical protein
MGSLFVFPWIKKPHTALFHISYITGDNYFTYHPIYDFFIWF